MKKELKNKGITLIALIITIIVLFILAGITIGSLTGNNGIIKRTIGAKDETEIAEEKEIVNLSVIQARGSSKKGDLTKEGLRKNLDRNSDGREIKLYSGENEYVVVFQDTHRAYIVDLEDNVTIGDDNILNPDSTPGEIAKGDDGRTLTGTEEDPYIIMSIEDLVTMSKLSNEGNTLNNKYIKFGRNLSFKSELSYANYETREFNEYLGITEDIGLMEALTNENYNGFKAAKAFRGTLDGDGKALKSIYIKGEENVGFFVSGTNLKIKDLELTGKIICTGNFCGGFSAKDGTMTNCISRVNIETTGTHIGGFIGQYGTTNNCSYYGKITGSGTNVGGCIGNLGSCVNCKNYGEISGYLRVGGVNGISGTCTDCENNGIIFSEDGGAGGISGSNGNSTNCINKGKVSSDAGGAGGINGIYGSCIKCINYGKIIGNLSDSANIGGIIGQSNGKTIDKCINYGKVTGGTRVGGIIGTQAPLSNCINKGEITANSNCCGGISGWITSIGPIINCVNEGKVYSPNRAGGIVGGADYTQNDTSKLINCYNIGEVLGNTNIVEVAGYKSGYGTHYIVNCYGILDSGNPLYGTGAWNVTNCVGYTKEYMKTNEFLAILNNYVEEYNAGEDKSYTNSIDLLSWKIDEETGYPTLDME